VRLRKLQPDDDRSAFGCGDADYDDYLHKYAGQNQFRHRVGVTIVAVEDERIVGYATVSPGHVEADELTDSDRARLPRYPLPVIRLGRLAVDARMQGLGLGTRLIYEVLDLAERMRDELGCVAVVADVLRSRIAFYEEIGFRPLKVATGRSPVAGTIPMYLAVRKVGKARPSDVGQ
jgi:GNAT superfamily N-acetyltransferase